MSQQNARRSSRFAPRPVDSSRPIYAYLELLLRDDVFVDELISVLLQDGRLRPYLLVHDGLREHRLVRLVVTVTSITYLHARTQLWLCVPLSICGVSIMSREQ